MLLQYNTNSNVIGINNYMMIVFGKFSHQKGLSVYKSPY